MFRYCHLLDSLGEARSILDKWSFLPFLPQTRRLSPERPRRPGRQRLLASPEPAVFAEHRRRRGEHAQRLLQEGCGTDRPVRGAVRVDVPHRTSLFFPSLTQVSPTATSSVAFSSTATTTVHDSSPTTRPSATSPPSPRMQSRCFSST